MSEVNERFDSQAQAVISRARQDAKDRGHLLIGPLHLLSSLLVCDDQVVAQILSARGPEIANRVLNALATLGPQARLASEEAEFKNLSLTVIEQAFAFAGLRHSEKVSVQDLLLSMIFNQDVAILLAELGFDMPSFQRDTREIVGLVEHSSNQGERLISDLRKQLNHALNILGQLGAQLQDLEARYTFVDKKTMD